MFRGLTLAYGTSRFCFPRLESSFEAAGSLDAQAHLTIVFAALAISRWIEHQTGWSIRTFVRTARWAALRWAPCYRYPAYKLTDD